MSAFFTDVLDGLLMPVFLEGVMEKYHFINSQAAGLREVAQEMLPLMRKEAFWERKGCPMQPQKPGRMYESVAMSLGKGIDCLQKRYSERDWLLQSYMLESLSSEILRKGYDAYSQYMGDKTGWHAVRYHFLGSEEAFPIELLPGLIKEFTPRITCNPALYMLPSKSVVFISELTQDAGVECEGICVGCADRYCRMAVKDSLEED